MLASAYFWVWENVGKRFGAVSGEAMFAGAVCCLLLLSWSLSSNSVLAVACGCLLGHVFAPCSMELILNLNSSWLYCLLLLALVCFSFFGLFRLALAALAACAFRSIATQVC